MSDCSDVEGIERALWHLVLDIGVKKSTGVSKATVGNLALSLKVERPRVKTALEGLVAARLIKLDEMWRIHVIGDSCELVDFDELPEDCPLKILARTLDSAHEGACDGACTHAPTSVTSREEVISVLASSSLWEDESSSSGRIPRKSPDKWNSADLAQYFYVQVTNALPGIPNVANAEALKGTFNRWLKTMSALEVKTAIDAFAENPPQHLTGAPWKYFVSNRATYFLHYGKKKARVEEVKRDRYNEEVW